jgi:hypothetical protein
MYFEWSMKEWIRLDALRRVKRGELTAVAAAELMGRSLRQARRVWKRFKELGDAGLVHRLRGRASNRRLPANLTDRVVKRHQERYADFGPTLACEKLAEDGLALSPDTLTVLLKEMRLRNIRSMEAGNALLEVQLLADLERRYAVTAHQDTDLHRALDASILLEEVLCVQEVRVVGREQPQLETVGGSFVEEVRGRTADSACKSRSGCACARLTGGKEEERVTFLLRLAR